MIMYIQAVAMAIIVMTLIGSPSGKPLSVPFGGLMASGKIQDLVSLCREQKNWFNIFLGTPSFFNAIFADSRSIVLKHFNKSIEIPEVAVPWLWAFSRYHCIS